jgi:hypothetical protein
MTDYHLRETPRTASGALLFGLIFGGHLVVAPPVALGQQQERAGRHLSTYYIGNTISPSFDQTYEPLSSIGRYFQTEEEDDEEFAKGIVAFCSQLSQQQKTLEPDFERILRDNLWELYSA